VKKILVVALLLFLAIAIVACSNKNSSDNSTPTKPIDLVTDNGLTLKLKDNNTYAIVSCSGESTNLIIPETHNGIKITSISTGSFDNCNSITKISIPSTIAAIETGALKGCTNLIEIEIPFVGSDLNGTKSGRFDYIFGDAVPHSLEKVIITGGTKISMRAFENCSYLEYIILPDSLTEVGTEAFKNCSGLDSIAIPDGVTKMGDYILKGCSSIKSITIPFVGSLRYTEPVAALFDNCDYVGLGLWYVPASLESVTFTKLTEIPSLMFNECTNVKTITIPTTLEKIEGYYYTLPYKSILDIYYQGTTAQWEAIDKEADWAMGVKDYTIHCSDGIITK